MTTATIVKLMSEQEAREKFNLAKEKFAQIKTGFRDLSELLSELKQGDAFNALGYSSWADCVKGELGFSSTAAYRKLAAATVEGILGDSIPQDAAITEREFELLKRVIPPTPEEMTPAIIPVVSNRLKNILQNATVLAQNKGKEQRTFEDTNQATDAELYPNWFPPIQKFEVEVDFVYYIDYELSYEGRDKWLSLTISGPEKSISPTGVVTQKIKLSNKMMDKYPHPDKLLEEMISQFYEENQRKIQRKKELQLEFPVGTQVKIIQNVGNQNLIGKLTTVLDHTDLGMRLQCSELVFSPTHIQVINELDHDDNNENIEVTELEHEIELLKLENQALKLKASYTEQSEPEEETEETIESLREQIKALEQLTDKSTLLERMEVFLKVKKFRGANRSLAENILIEFINLIYEN